MELLKSGGVWGQAAAIPGQDFGWRPPRAVVDFSNYYRPDPRRDSAMLRPATTRDLKSSRWELQGEIASIFATDTP